jgi:hypothetical protein
MTSIDSTGRLLAQMREQVAAVARTAPAMKTTAGRGPSSGPKAAPRDIADLVAQRVLAIDPQDIDRKRKAFRIFLEAVIVDEFGNGLINDPAFHQMVDTVQQTMERKAALKSAIEKAGDFLLQTACRNPESG